MAKDPNLKIAVTMANDNELHIHTLAAWGASLVLAVTVTAIFMNGKVIWRIFQARIGRRRLQQKIRALEIKLASSPQAGLSKEEGTFNVIGLFIYPVKSLRGTFVPDSQLTERGLLHDRQFMLVTPYPGYQSRRFPGATHRFLTQRSCPSLATINVTMSCSDAGQLTSLTLQRQPPKFAWEPPFTLNLSANIDRNEAELSSSPLATRPCSNATVWDDVVAVSDLGYEAAAYFEGIVCADSEVPSEWKVYDFETSDESKTMTKRKGVGVRMVQQDTNTCTRRANQKFVPAEACSMPSWRSLLWNAALETALWGSKAVMFAPFTSLNDGFPILVTCEASLDELNRRIQLKSSSGSERPSILPMSRFRPNIVVAGTKPFEEDTWRTIAIVNPPTTTANNSNRNNVTILHIVKGCPRCKQSCTDQETGWVDTEPAETLASFRANLSSTAPKDDVFFGQNATVSPCSVGNVIRAGATVHVLERGSPVWG
jgi:uncharacterized protein YcbX